MSGIYKAIVPAPFDIETTEKPFGKRWGQQTVKLTAEDLSALQNGECIAVDAMNEYIIFLQLER